MSSIGSGELHFQGAVSIIKRLAQDSRAKLKQDLLVESPALKKAFDFLLNSKKRSDRLDYSITRLLQNLDELQSKEKRVEKSGKSIDQNLQTIIQDLKNYITRYREAVSSEPESKEDNEVDEKELNELLEAEDVQPESEGFFGDSTIRLYLVDVLRLFQDFTPDKLADNAAEAEINGTDKSAVPLRSKEFAIYNCKLLFSQCSSETHRQLAKDIATELNKIHSWGEFYDHEDELNELAKRIKFEIGKINNPP